jgi:hypothetical protein
MQVVAIQQEHIMVRQQVVAVLVQQVQEEAEVQV